MSKPADAVASNYAGRRKKVTTKKRTKRRKRKRRQNRAPKRTKRRKRKKKWKSRNMRGGHIVDLRGEPYTLDNMRDKINEIIRILNGCCPDGYAPEAHFATLQENLRTGNRTLGLARVAETQNIAGRPRNVNHALVAFPESHLWQHREGGETVGFDPPPASRRADNRHRYVPPHRRRVHQAEQHEPATMTDEQLFRFAEEATGRPRHAAARRRPPTRAQRLAAARRHQREPGRARRESTNRLHVVVGRNLATMRRRVHDAIQNPPVGVDIPHLWKILQLMSILQDGVFYISDRPPSLTQVLKYARDHDTSFDGQFNALIQSLGLDQPGHAAAATNDIQEALTLLRQGYRESLP